MNEFGCVPTELFMDTEIRSYNFLYHKILLLYFFHHLETILTSHGIKLGGGPYMLVDLQFAGPCFQKPKLFWLSLGYWMPKWPGEDVSNLSVFLNIISSHSCRVALASSQVLLLPSGTLSATLACHIWSWFSWVSGPPTLVRLLGITLIEYLDASLSSQEVSF